jgi:hypothetical protein
MHLSPEQPSVGQRKRLRRVERRASQAVKTALANGKISPRRADTLLYLSENRQQEELDKIFQAQTLATLRAKAAVEILKAHLASGTRDLVKLRGDLREALGECVE